MQLSQTLFYIAMHVIERNTLYDWTRKQPTKIECTNKDFKPVKEYFLSTEIRLKSFNEISFQDGKTKSRAISCRKSIIMNSTQLICQEMLTNGRVLGDRVTGRCARTRKGRLILLSIFFLFLLTRTTIRDFSSSFLALPEEVELSTIFLEKQGFLGCCKMEA